MSEDGVSVKKSELWIVPFVYVLAILLIAIFAPEVEASEARILTVFDILYLAGFVTLAGLGIAALIRPLWDSD